MEGSQNSAGYVLLVLQDNRNFITSLTLCRSEKHASQQHWHRTISGWLTDEKVWGAGKAFVQGSNDPCIFVNKSTGMRLVLVVDDILCRGSKEATEAFYKSLEARFECKDPSYLTEEVPLTYVGFQVRLTTRTGRRYVSIDQEDDLTNYLDSIEVPEAVGVYNPMPNKWEASTGDEVLSADRAAWYRAVVGSIPYYSCATRYDIAYAISRLAQYSSNPTAGAERALQRVLRYLRCNIHFRIIGDMDVRGDEVKIYSDSDHAGSRGEGCRSQTGTIILLNGAPVYWKSKKQPVTAISSACAEIYALSDTVKDSRLFMWRSQELGMPVVPLVVQVDNAQAKSFKEGTCVQSKL